MARIAEARPPAAPVSQTQMARRDAILQAAADFGTRHGFDHMQMNDVAKEARVAVGTLYRYFPSKVHLLSAVFDVQILEFTDHEWPDAGDDPLGSIGDGLVGLIRTLLRRPRLGAAMVHASVASYTINPVAPERRSDSAIHRAVLRSLGHPEPGEEELRAVELLAYCWWGTLVDGLGDRVSLEQVEARLTQAVMLLLAPYAPQRAAPPG